ncbi:hypothetical protein K438DRAFT_1779226 [Mycena galopus ATCC 62051]|nr:hypothetical protein K438DRAFT_1779226 [Mycena galopus ATCC 62051]
MYMLGAWEILQVRTCSEPVRTPKKTGPDRTSATTLGGKGGNGGGGGVEGGGGGVGEGPTVNYDIKAVENFTTNISLWLKGISGTGESVLSSAMLDEITVAFPAKPALRGGPVSLTETKSLEILQDSLDFGGGAYT